MHATASRFAIVGAGRRQTITQATTQDINMPVAQSPVQEAGVHPSTTLKSRLRAAVDKWKARVTKKDKIEPQFDFAAMADPKRKEKFFRLLSKLAHLDTCMDICDFKDCAPPCRNITKAWAKELGRLAWANYEESIRA